MTLQKACLIASVVIFIVASLGEWPIESVEPIAVGLALFAAAHWS